MKEWTMKVMLMVVVWGLLSIGGTEAAMNIVTGGKPTAVVVLGEKPTWLEQHAAEELVKYVRAMSGATLPLCREGEALPGEAENQILLGRPETHGLLAQLVAAGQLQLSPEQPGGDGFILQTLRPSPPAFPSSYLILGGSADRGTLYAVYYFLEHLCRVGFFQDGDRVPRRESIGVPELDIAQRPHFEIRQYLQGCAFGYTTAYWEWEDWQRELDWMAKRYQNTMMVPWGHPEARRIADYARKLGIKTILPGAGQGQVSEEFRQQHPQARYVKMQWGENPPYYVIHPADPLFVERGVEIIRQNIAAYGTDHLYNVDPYPEQKVFLPPEEVEQMRAEFAKATAAYIRQADPEGVWYASGWALLAPPWPPETARAFLEAIPPEMFYLCDIWADERPLYQKFDYYYGRDWGFGVLHSFGGDDTLRGDLAGLIRRVQEVANDPRADRCRAFYINPEIIHYNLLYFELAAKLSWNPRGVNLADFLRHYALCRYGEEAAENMLACLQRLAQSVYATSSRATEPYYQHRLTRLAQEPAKYAHLEALREALTFALRERERLQDNPLYAHDLVDILRQYLAELSNYHLQQLYRAFVEGNRGAFEREATAVGQLLDGLEKILSTREDYCIRPLVEKARRLTGDPNVERAVKDGMFTFAGTPWLRDYQSKDMFELVKFYYRPRVEAFIAALRKALKPLQGLPTTPNLLHNGGFEEGEENQPAQWQTFFVYRGGTASRTAEEAYRGQYSGRLHIPEEGGYANLQQDLEAGPGEAYFFRAYLKVAGSCRAHLHVDFMHGEGQWPQSVFAQETVGLVVQGPSDWSPVQGWFVTPERTARMRLYCRAGGQGTAWFDEVSLQKVSLAEAPVLRPEELAAAYDAIEQRWLEEPLPTAERYPGTSVEAVAEVWGQVQALVGQ